MRIRNAVTLAAAAAFALLPVLARASSDTTVKGEILDLACYVGHNASGAEHAPCAEKCLKSGQPMGLKAADGTVYLLFADHGNASSFEEAKGFAGKTVEVTGEMESRDGIQGITVHGVKAL
jgi:hypothetical protein